MKCPCCKSELVEWKQLRLETLEEHVFDPNGNPSLKMAYRCSDEACVTNPNIYWNEFGERYGGESAIPFIDDNDAPFGSFQRKCNVEIYKKDENKHLCTFPCWPLKGWKVRSNYSYQSNEDGDILSRKLKLEWIRPDGCIHIWGYRMVLYGLRQVVYNWKMLRKDTSNSFARSNLEDVIRRKSWPRAEWWRKVNAFFAKVALKHASRPDEVSWADEHIMEGTDF